MQAIVVTQVGGPEVLVPGERALPEPGPEQARVRLHAIGVNFIDVYQRTGRYPLPLPLVPGQEAAGVVEAVGSAVREVKVGDRVAYAGEVGAYAEAANVAAWRLVPLPAQVSFKGAAASMLQGMTAQFLTRQTFPVGSGHTVLVHAAAGGMGLWLTALCKALGARVIGTAGSAEKAALARAAGAAEVILYRERDFPAEVQRLTGGAGVDVVYDGVGQSTFAGSLASLRRRGMLVLYGAASGPVPPVDPMTLTQHGSLFLTRPSLAHHATTREEVLALATPLLDGLAAGALAVRIDRALPLAQAAEAHRLLEARATSGKLLLTPGSPGPAGEARPAAQ